MQVVVLVPQRWVKAMLLLEREGPTIVFDTAAAGAPKKDSGTEEATCIDATTIKKTYFYLIRNCVHAPFL